MRGTLITQQQKKKKKINLILLIKWAKDQTDFSPKKTDGQNTHKNMLNVINNQKNTNQNHSEISLYTC